jgi:hypothetical protein
MPGDTDEAVVDDLNVDEAQPTTEESFPDPDLEAEAAEAPSGDEDVSVEEPSAVLPPPEAPPPPPQYIPPPPPPSDGGFTPSIPPRSEPVQAQPEIKFFTTEQLRQGVNDGLITEDQMVTQLQLQTKEQAKREALQAFQQQAQAQTVTQQLNEYRQLIPGWDQTGTQANQQATPAFLRLLQLGLADNDTTRLLALEQTFGPVNRMKEARATKARTASLRPTPQEVGRRAVAPPRSGRKDPLDSISLEEKKLYREYIRQGHYKDWNAVRAEIKDEGALTVNPGLRAKVKG